MHFGFRVSRSLSVVGVTAGAVVGSLFLTSCGSSDPKSAPTSESTTSEKGVSGADASQADATSETTDLSTGGVSIVEAPPQESETIPLAKPDDPNSAVPNPNFPAAAATPVTQTVEECEPLAKAYDATAAAWLAVKIIAESDQAVRKSFDTQSIAEVRDGLAALRTALATDVASVNALAKIDRGFTLILDATGNDAAPVTESDPLAAFVKETPDLAAVPKPISTALRAKGCIVVQY
jgi:hypothetical protein